VAAGITVGLMIEANIWLYQHCDEKHLHRYLNEYDFRYNNRVALGVNDDARAVKALKGVVGKRLTYRTIGSSNAGQEAQG
jgi:hypothetical protein